MKVCILSMQRVDNMGSLLQAYALKTIIEKAGNEVEFIDIEKRDEDYKLLGDYRQEYPEEREITGLVGKIKKIDRYTLNRLKIKKQHMEQKALYETFREKYLAIEKKSPRYDICVIGSDEVFNCLSSGAWGFTSQLFGNVPEAKAVITYAASCGSTKYDDIPDVVVDRIRKTFKNIEGFSARDKNTHEFIARLMDKEVNDNLDPVLIYDFDKEVEHEALPELPKHYCVIYSYYNRIHSAKEIETIKLFCKRNGLTPVAVGAPQFWLKKFVVCSPFQCLKIFQNADFVITDTFHGTIFSAKYAKKFAVLVRKSNQNKLADLVGRIKIGQHLLKDISELNDKYRIASNKDRFNYVIKQERKNTMDYLKNAINRTDVLMHEKENR